VADLDDLPKRTPEHVGESESRDAFRRLVGDPLFLVRDEVVNDYGVDVTLEALLDGAYPTNFRLHAQLKSSTKKPNSDKSYSYRVARSNLNYLFNSTNALYVFYSRTERHLLYRYVENVVAEYERTGPAWRSQDELTVQFAEILDQAALVRIHARLIDAGRRERDARIQRITLEAQRPTAGGEDAALANLAWLFDTQPVSPKLLVFPASSATDARVKPVPKNLVDVLDALADHQLRKNEPVSGRVLRASDDLIAPLVRDRHPRPPGQIMPTDQVQPYWVRRDETHPRTTFSLTLWGWLDSKYGERVRTMLDDGLKLFRVLEDETPGFGTYSWEQLRAIGVARSDDDLPLVQRIWYCLGWPYGGATGEWRAPPEPGVVDLLKLVSQQELLQRRLWDELRAEARTVARRRHY